MRSIEIWADSFHEGVWCCDNICKELIKNGGSYKSDFINGFIPHYLLGNVDDYEIELVVYGSYKSWTPMPQKIKELIHWGKPDFLAYDADKDVILFAVEETAATPTGNQAMQRCERQYGSAHLRIPYWYLVAEYGEHEDGGLRRDNIWPTIAAMKLSIIERTPCIVVHYSDYDSAENYNAGNGLEFLFSSLTCIIKNFENHRYEFYDMKSKLNKQYREMTRFVSLQWDNVIDYMPSKEMLQKDSTANMLTQFALNEKNAPLAKMEKKHFLVWPLTNGLPKEVLKSQKGKKLIKYDPLAEKLEKDVSEHRCYILSNNAGSGKPTTKEKVIGWIKEQRKLFENSPELTPPAEFTMKIEDFPKTKNGNIHITTSKNIVYLYDKWSDLRHAIETAYPRLIDKLINIPDEKPVFLYICNSIVPGRMFGDPFTGQITAYSVCFGKLDNPSRAVVAYFPHQVHTQLFDKNGKIISNKGTTLYKEFTDYMIFNAGVAVSIKDGRIY